MKDAKLLVANSDAAVRGILRVAAGEEGLDYTEATNGIAVLKLFRRRKFHIAILDYDLAELNGRIVCRQIRKSTSLPIILLSTHTGEVERLTGFSAGANDYVLKPFYPREIMVRAKSLLCLYGYAPERCMSLVRGKISIDLFSHKAFIDNRLSY